MAECAQYKRLIEDGLAGRILPITMVDRLAKVDDRRTPDDTAIMYLILLKFLCGRSMFTARVYPYAVLFDVQRLKFK